MKKRIEWLDIARGIAMISIVLGHLGVATINRVVFLYHLPIFFLISGYFIDVKLSTPDFCKKKIRSLIVPYLFCCLWICGLSIPFSLLLKQDVFSNLWNWVYASAYGAGAPFDHFLSFPAIGALWFLWATFWGEIILRKLLNYHPAITTLGVCTYFAFGVLTHRMFWLPLSFQAGGPAILYMYIGHLLRKYQSAIKMHMNFKMELIFTCVSFAACFYSVKRSWVLYLVYADFSPWYLLPISLGACFLLMQVSKLIEKGLHGLSRVLSSAGKYSLLFLCLHIIELNLFPWYKLIVHFVPSQMFTYEIYLIGSGILQLTFIALFLFLCLHVPLICRINQYPCMRIKQCRAFDGKEN